MATAATVARRRASDGGFLDEVANCASASQGHVALQKASYGGTTVEFKTLVQDLDGGPILRNQLQDRWLVVSPYLEDIHKLDLTTVDFQDQCMAIALQELSAARDDYAVCSYSEAFWWDRVVERIRHFSRQTSLNWVRREYYVVEFRSKVKEDINVELLYRLDKESHAEAMQSGGLLKYWYGKPDESRRNLATCKKKSDCAYES